MGPRLDIHNLNRRRQKSTAQVTLNLGRHHPPIQVRELSSGIVDEAMQHEAAAKIDIAAGTIPGTMTGFTGWREAARAARDATK